MEDIKQILDRNNPQELRALFSFDSSNSNEQVLFKFNIWARFFFVKFFSVTDADFHKEIDLNNLKAYRAEIKSLLNLAFRGASKSTRAKLFIAYCICNDIEHSRKYIKILSHDMTNCKQFVTDIYNLLVQPRVKQIYTEIFEKTETKREETMASFTTATGIKVIADTVGSSQRGSIQEEARPDLIIFDDFETRETIRSAVKTKAIWDNMQEAKDGLSPRGACIYLGNYISEAGNVQKLVERKSQLDIVLTIPIIKDGVITWQDRYSKQDVDYLQKTSDDFAGEYLCKPDASKDIYFDREILDKMEVKTPIKDISGFKIYKTYNPSHRYAGGHDIAGGVGLDSSASVFIDFSTIPAQVVGTYASNVILPEAFGDEIYFEANHFGGCLVAPENNKYDQTILKAKQLGANIYKARKGQSLKTIAIQSPYIYGWNTNSLTKSKMMSDFRKACNDGLIALNDKNLINEAKTYTRNNLIDSQPDPRDINNSTRHFDLLTAAAICWQMKDHAESKTADDMLLDYVREPSSNPAE